MASDSDLVSSQPSNIPFETRRQLFAFATSDTSTVVQEVIAGGSDPPPEQRTEIPAFQICSPFSNIAGTSYSTPQARGSVIGDASNPFASSIAALQAQIDQLTELAAGFTPHASGPGVSSQIVFTPSIVHNRPLSPRQSRGLPSSLPLSSAPINIPPLAHGPAEPSGQRREEVPIPEEARRRDEYRDHWDDRRGEMFREPSPRYSERSSSRGRRARTPRSRSRSPRRHQEYDPLNPRYDAENPHPHRLRNVPDANMGHPFSYRVRHHRVHRHVKLPAESYDGTKDPISHLNKVKDFVQFQTRSDAALCQIFVMTLSGVARLWFEGLPAGSIDNFSQLEEKFRSRFSTAIPIRKSAAALFDIHRKPQESLNDFLGRFDLEMSLTPGVTIDFAVEALKRNCRYGKLRDTLTVDPPLTLDALRLKAHNYARMEEEENRERIRDMPTDPYLPPNAPHGNAPDTRPTDDYSQRKEHTAKASNRQRGNFSKGRPGGSPTRKQADPPKGRIYDPDLPSLILPRAEILAIVQQRNLPIRYPAPVKPGVIMGGRENAYCKFHKVKGHSTDVCRELKLAIERLVEEGYLGEFATKAREGAKNNPTEMITDQRQMPSHATGANAIPLGQNREALVVHSDQMPMINIIAGGTPYFEEAKPQTPNPGEKRKREGAQVKIEAISALDRMILSFSEEDEKGIVFPHNDALVVTPVIGSHGVRRTLVDNGSAVNLFSLEAYNLMKRPDGELAPCVRPIVGIDGVPIPVAGITSLSVYFREDTSKRSEELLFLVVDLTLPYNAILGRPFLNRFGAAISQKHLRMKYPSWDGVVSIKGDQKLAAECYLLMTQRSCDRYVCVADDPFDDKEEKRTQPLDQMMSMPIGEDSEANLLVSEKLSPEENVQITRLLRKCKGEFAWKPADMPGISREVAEHRLNVSLDAKPIQQKRRAFSSEKIAAIEKELLKLTDAGFIREVQYPTWLANPVLVPKPNGDWRMCIDFTDLNNACPKDCYPLPRIDQLVDRTAGYAYLSSLDANSGYHQIPMATEDEEKTAFITPRATYCYTAMPFGLKNAGATFQRMANRVFEKQIGRNVEAYVDDILVKSRSFKDHLADLEEVFSVMREYKMKLNPRKCMFAFQTGKFLGYVVSRKGIQPNPSKIKAIQDMIPPRTVKEIQKLTGRIIALGRFISKQGERCLPFFKVIRNKAPFGWTEECEKAFAGLKAYLSSDLVLTRPEFGDELYLYLGVADEVVSAVLVRSEGHTHRPVFFVSHILKDAELRYARIEKIALALIQATRKMDRYFQAHPVTVLTDQPLRKIFRKPESSGRMLIWAIELEQYGLQYKARPAIKAQALADFIAECTFTKDAEIDLSEEESENSCLPFPETYADSWVIHVDGAKNQELAGAGVFLVGPNGMEIRYAIRILQPLSNNAAEYEALLAGLRIGNSFSIEATPAAEEEGGLRLKIRGDSKLIMDQVQGNSQAREPIMIQYLAKVKRELSEMQKKGTQVTFEHIPRENNEEADSLAKMAANLEASIPNDVHYGELSAPSFMEEQASLCVEEIESDWRTPVIEYLKHDKLPEENAERKKILKRAARCTYYNGELIRRCFSHPAAKCITEQEGLHVLREIHEGICGMHVASDTLASQVFRSGYYWPTIRRDCHNFVKTCQKCQEYAKIPRKPAVQIAEIVAPCPFAKWGIDILGPFPMARSQLKFVVVAVDYFTKWAEAEALATITTEKIWHFFKHQVIMRFGVPRILVSDNGTQFTSQFFRDQCAEFQIEQRFSSVAHPQTNGQAEVTNRSILSGIKRNLEGSKKKWPDELPYVLWAYRMTIKASTGETPFALAFGTEAVTPVEIGTMSLRVAHFREETNEERLRANLDALPETHEETLLKTLHYKRKMAQYHNRQVRERLLKAGDLVLRDKRAAGQRMGKLSPNWDGPYRVTRVVGRGAYHLETLEGTPLPNSWNIARLKLYHARGGEECQE